VKGSAWKLDAPRTNIVADAVRPHETMILAIQRRAPTRRKIRLLGISKMK
jgi:hypothetical protein